MNYMGEKMKEIGDSFNFWIQWSKNKEYKVAYDGLIFYI